MLWFKRHTHNYGIKFAVKLDDLIKYMRTSGLQDGEIGVLQRRGDIYILKGVIHKEDK